MIDKLQAVGLFPELLGVGGVQEASRQLVRALQNILARRRWAGTYLGLNDPPGEQALAFDQLSIPLQGFSRSKIKFVLQAMRLAMHHPRIVIAAHPNLAVPARWMKKLSPATRTIVLCHGVEVWGPLPSRRTAALLAADMVLAPSTYTAEKLRSVQGVSSEQIRVLPWPLGAEMLKLSENASNLPLPKNFPEGRVILTVGRWAAAERYKGVDNLVRAMPQLLISFPELQLVAIGGGDDLPRLKTIAAELGVTPSVHFLEGISRPQLAACYAHSEIFALPSTGEGFGIVFLEAMAFGLPVVGAPAGGITDLVQDEVNGLLVPRADAPALVETLSRILRDPVLGSKLGCRGAQIVRENYQTTVFEHGLESILIDCGLDSSPTA